ncbi:MAG TPA: hypothetical protein VME23_17665 [Terracidiphilus sp.]|nr:hypothetical protein [Terracidiphilus sp.]
MTHGRTAALIALRQKTTESNRILFASTRILFKHGAFSRWRAAISVKDISSIERV